MSANHDKKGPAGAYAPRVAIAMRSYDDIDVIRGTLEMIQRQTYRNTATALHPRR